MSDPFSLQPTSGKSWADIVEEEEEYNRLHPDSDSEQEEEQDLLFNDQQPSLLVPPVTIATTTTEENKEEKDQEANIKETEKEIKPILTGAKASRWATAPPSDTPIKKWSRPSIVDNNEKSGAMASKWAKAPSTTTSSKSRYDNNKRLNRNNFNQDTAKRNHYNREFDSYDRNGGFDNKDNFKHLRQKNLVSTTAKEEEEEEKLLSVVEKGKPLPKLDLKPLPPSFSWADDIDEPSSKEEEKEKPLPLAYSWGSLKEANKEEQVAIKKEQEKPLLPVTYTWGSLEEEPKRQDQVISQDKENGVHTWGASSQEKEEEEKKPLSQTPPTNIDLFAVSDTKEKSWNPNVSWNNDNQTNNSAWGDINEEKPTIKDTWKSQIPKSNQDNSSKWKAFAESVVTTAPAPAPIVQQSLPIATKGPTVSVSDQSSSTTTTKDEKPLQKVSFSLKDLDNDDITTNSNKNLSFSFNEFNDNQQAGEPQQISFSLNDLVGSPTQEKSSGVFFQLSDLDDPETKPILPKVISLKLSDFDSQPNTEKKGLIQEEEMKNQHHPKSWRSVSKTPIYHATSNDIVETSEPPRRKLQLAGAQWNNIQKNLVNK